MDIQRFSDEQVVRCVADLSHPNVCMQSGDYMRWLLQTTNHITYGYGNLTEMHKCYCHLWAKVPGHNTLARGLMGYLRV